MNSYESSALNNMEMWKRKKLKRAGILNRTAKKAQVKFNSVIPEKVHKVVTDSIKNMVQVTLAGSGFTSNNKIVVPESLEDKEKYMKERLSFYRKAAAIEGAGTGAGGLFLGLADFPLLLSIKMKYLYETAKIHGYDPKAYEERLFMLYVFQLAFSSEDHRREVFSLIDNWEEYKREASDMDWKVFQQEYRDYIDFVKMFQLVPGIGAVVGAYANYGLLDELGEAAEYAYRRRYFGQG
ncbi:EcsC family protein [Bacillus salacetis]|uniref:EcsC family protein n=1 Tax=Bacillus salacetis TaxID=2315464 RepID=A0A3A1R1F8_9BACI|nr:EcsC family protein [Bacillus salacetis]RIW35356.1 EcsC family protein [Bacillus salacetis]